MDMWNAPPGFRPTKSAPTSLEKPLGLVDKDPEKAVFLFWTTIHVRDKLDSALKDMTIIMKQQNRVEEANEAIKSLRHQCSDQAQESLDNILLDLSKETLKRTRSGKAIISSSKIEMLFATQSMEPGKPKPKTRRLYDETEDKLSQLLPNNKDFEEAVLAAILGLANSRKTIRVVLKVFQDITLSLNPRA
ncbi:hypothetical protein SADUNF_Sadunf05G0082300 [Salix dunnii]|uniref:Uncharacterized protein n=1 Tax=Salix dunnii TaxID=1413687 RepID=A0A835KC29_9ROSI|nr:hypothetical protein SADUNF_Sadunf05G0082300 [Salix dunnii]